MQSRVIQKEWFTPMGEFYKLQLKIPEWACALGSSSQHLFWHGKAAGLSGMNFTENSTFRSIMSGNKTEEEKETLHWGKGYSCTRLL